MQNSFYSEITPNSQFCCRVKDLKNILYGKNTTEEEKIVFYSEAFFHAF